jgi:hypothetical protein
VRVLLETLVALVAWRALGRELLGAEAEAVARAEVRACIWSWSWVSMFWGSLTGGGAGDMVGAVVAGGAGGSK